MQITTGIISRFDSFCGAILTMVLLPAVMIGAGDEQKVLFNGTNMDGWRPQSHGTWSAVAETTLDAQEQNHFKTKPGTGVLVNSARGTTCDLLSEFEHGDCELQLEFMIAKGSNSGVYLMGRYEVQVFDSFGKEKPSQHDCGAIYERWKDNAGFEGRAPSTNTCKPAGEWQSFQITFRAPRFDAAGKKTANARFIKVVQNGKVIQENYEPTGPTRAATFGDEKSVGPLMLQGDHGTVAYRNIKLTPRKQ